MIINNQTRNTTLTDQGKVADTFFTRLKGLLGSPPLQEGQGLLLKNEKSIHTFFMSFSIDVLYIDKALQVIRIDYEMPPYRLGSFVKNAAYILELPAGMAKQTRTVVGDQLEFSR